MKAEKRLSYVFEDPLCTSLQLSTSIVYVPGMI